MTGVQRFATEFGIGNRHIALNHPVYVMAEAGVNHNGDLVLAKRLVDVAVEAGADCVKFQTFKADRVATASASKAEYQKRVTDATESQREMLRKLELGFDQHVELRRYCDSRNIDFLSTPYNAEDVALLERVGVHAFKLASLHMAEPPFLRQVAAVGKPMIISTGMATLEEIRAGLEAVLMVGNHNVVLLQCTTNYPSRIEDANLLAMVEMAREFNVLVGYSDHTEGDTACLAAVALGARVIEKHITLNKAMDGPDHSTSADPDEFAALVKRVREVERSLGSPFKTPSEAELENTPGMRRSIVMVGDLKAGTVIGDADLAFKRPGTGIPVAQLDAVVGQRLSRDVFHDEMLSWSDLDGAR